MSKVKIAIYAGVFVTALAATLFFLSRSGMGPIGDAVEVDWRLLGELDYISGKAPADLSSLDGKMVRIPGFMIPLEDNAKEVKEFLLVPTPQACIHVPPPPPNQMVLVEMVEGSKGTIMFGPVWIYGKLSLSPKRHFYGVSSFTLAGTYIEQYK